MATYAVTVQVASITDDGWEGSEGLPTFQVEAADPGGAVTKALNIVSGWVKDSLTFHNMTDTTASATASNSIRRSQYHVSVTNV